MRAFLLMPLLVVAACGGSTDQPGDGGMNTGAERDPFCHWDCSSRDACQDGVVTERFFLGSQWLYHLGTPVGQLVVTSPNGDDAPVEEQGRIGLDWSSRALRVLPETHGALKAQPAQGSQAPSP